MAENGKSVVQSAAKVFAVLKAFDRNLPELTVTEIAARAQLDRGTAFRLVHTLMDLGYVRGVPDSKRYRLTLKCLELGFTALAGRDLPAHARPLLREVVPAVADAGSLGMLERGEVIYVERVQTVPERLGIDRRPGSRIGAYAAALGHAILAFLPRDEQIAHLQSVERVKLSERTLIGMEALLKQTGYSYNSHNATTWSVDLTRKHLGKVKVILSTGSDILVTFVILAKKAAIQKTPQLMDALLIANHDYDYTKIGLDKDGDMFVRIDMPLRILDAAELKTDIDQVANASDEVYVKVAQWIKK